MFPIYKKELQSFFYTPFAYAIAALFLLLFTLPLASSISKMEGTNRIVFSFTEMFYAVILYFIFLLPILTMRTFADERKNGTEVLLMTSPVSVAKIVIAKFLANLTVYLFMLVCSLFFPIITAIKGEVVISQLIHRHLLLGSNVHRTWYAHLLIHRELNYCSYHR
jgi:ABC-2 type transport system permease protein